MMLIPYERLTIKTTLRAGDALQRLEDSVEPRRYFRWWGSGHKPYEGKVEGDRFTIARIIHYRNSFLPIIKGEIQSELGGCSIHITMYPHILVIAFMVLWLGGVGFAFLSFLGYFISSVQTSGQQPFSPAGLLLPAGMLAFGYVLFWGSFKFESVKSKAFFRELFQAEQVDELGITDLFRKA